jgi:hypothetical protein
MFYLWPKAKVLRGGPSLHLHSLGLLHRLHPRPRQGRAPHCSLDRLQHGRHRTATGQQLSCHMYIRGPQLGPPGQSIRAATGLPQGYHGTATGPTRGHHRAATWQPRGIQVVQWMALELFAYSCCVCLAKFPCRGLEKGTGNGWKLTWTCNLTDPPASHSGLKP